MSTLTLQLPNSVHHHIKEIAKEDGVSINQFVLTAVSEKISAITTEADRVAFKNILDNVPARSPLAGDEL